MGTTTLCQKNVTSHETSFTFCGVVFHLSECVYPTGEPFGESGNDVEHEVLKQVKDQTGVRILYDAGKMKRVSCREMKIADLEVAEALRQILKDTRFEFFEEGGVFIVREALSQQAKVIRLVGMVTDEKKQPLPGVTVQLKGFSVGTATNRGRDVPIIHSECPGEVFFDFFFCGDDFSRGGLCGKGYY